MSCSTPDGPGPREFTKLVWPMLTTWAPRCLPGIRSFTPEAQAKFGLNDSLRLKTFQASAWPRAGLSTSNARPKLPDWQNVKLYFGRWTTMLFGLLDDKAG